jgi:hypothetical protein
MALEDEALAGLEIHGGEDTRSSGRQPAVVEGGVGAAALHRFTVTAGGRTRRYLMRVDEPQPGRVITETDRYAREQAAAST